MRTPVPDAVTRQDAGDRSSAGPRDLLPTYLADRDVPCPACGYNLRGLVTATCPECAQGLVLNVGLVDPRLGPWIAGLIGAAAGAGFNGLLLVYAAIMMVRSPRGGGFVFMFVAHNAVGLSVMGLVLAAWLRTRRRFRLAAGWKKTAVIGATWLLAAADVLVFSAIIR